MSPDRGDIGRWEHAGAHYTVYRDGLVTMYTDCGASADASPPAADNVALTTNRKHAH
jgi:hypothetical protein